LLNAGFEVTALVRGPEKAMRILPERASVVRADVHDIDSLKTGLSGQDAIYLSLSIAPTEKKDDFHAESEGLQNILEAAHANSIKRIGYLSAMVLDTTATDWWVLDIWRAATSQIKSSGIPYTIFYPTNLMETLAQRHVVGSLLALAGTSRFPNYWIAGGDYGAQVARSLQMTTAADREYFIQGPEAMTYDEAAHRFAKSAKKRFRVVKLPLAACSGNRSRLPRRLLCSRNVGGARKAFHDDRRIRPKVLIRSDAMMRSQTSGRRQSRMSRQLTELAIP
jgi:uncharacterized protein YbjT (DUF2867 family)